VRDILAEIETATAHAHATGARPAGDAGKTPWGNENTDPTPVRLPTRAAPAAPAPSPAGGDVVAVSSPPSSSAAAASSSPASSSTQPAPTSSGRKTMMGERLRLHQQQLRQEQEQEPATSSIEYRLLGRAPVPPHAAAPPASSSSSSSAAAAVAATVAAYAADGDRCDRDESFESQASSHSQFWNVSTDSENEPATHSTTASAAFTLSGGHGHALPSYATGRAAGTLYVPGVEESEEESVCNFDASD
jgi:hypothetical protein